MVDLIRKHEWPLWGKLHLVDRVIKFCVDCIDECIGEHKNEHEVGHWMYIAPIYTYIYMHHLFVRGK